VTSDTRILGIDPGTRVTGYGAIAWDRRRDRTRLVDAGVLRLDAELPIADRLVALQRDLNEVFAEVRPQHCAVERLFSHYKHPRTAILMGHARGVILLVARRHGARLWEMSPARVKWSLTGHGQATKGQMQAGVQAAFGLADPPEPHDVADALAVALCCCREAVCRAAVEGEAPAEPVGDGVARVVRRRVG